nr:hypothetical protein [Cohnella sp. GbtcB17]
MTQSVLTDNEVAFYRNEGYYLHKKPLFSPARFAELTAIFEDQLAQKGRQAVRRAEYAAFSRRAYALVFAELRSAELGRADHRSEYRTVVEPLYLQGPVCRPGYALAREFRLLERTAQLLRQYRDRMARD